MINPSSSIAAIGHTIFEALASAFPVACTSDEFFYFPQVRLLNQEWDTWDCFSLETVTEFAKKLSTWEDKLDQLTSLQLDLATQIDVTLLLKLTRTLREQLCEIQTWAFQPTFYLTLVGIGLTEAIESEDPAAKHERARSLPAFLDQASHNLNRVPVSFRDMGLEMAINTKNYLLSLIKALPELRPALFALDRFVDTLQKVSTRQDFLLSRDLFERILRFHLNCEMDLKEINDVLDQEIAEMKQILEQEAKCLASGSPEAQDNDYSWPEVLQGAPIPIIGREGLVKLYQEEINRLAKHCIETELVSPSLVSSCPVHVAIIPPFLSAIRTASSYSIPVKQPPSGGTFYLLNNRITDETRHQYLRQFRMTCAHETYPGHHLLDTTRLNLTQTLRRAVEQPIFCEGWACFAEELMRLTGYFSNRYDRLLLFQRRLMHAVRGKVDIGLQTGAMNITSAANCLKEVGIGDERAISLAYKYPLNPGYQLCYTLGLRRFLNLFTKFGNRNLPYYIRMILAQGEINFTDLEKTLKECQNN